jgi:hypothetical protein
MSWVVIDTNQAIRLKPSLLSSQLPNMEGFILPPFVLGELWKSDDRRPMEVLAQYPLRLGMSPGGAMERLASLRYSQIIPFRPFLNLSSQEIQRGLLNPSEEKLKKLVERMTAHIQDGTEHFLSAKKKTRDTLRSQGYDPRDFKFAGFSDALQKLCVGPHNVVTYYLSLFVSNCNTRKVRANPDALYISALKNFYLRHFFHTLFWYVLSFQQSWTKKYDKWNISIGKNNWTDITLALYPAPGDVILSADKNVRMAASAVNPDGAVKVM